MNNFLNYINWKDEVKSAGIENIADYRNYSQKHKNWPQFPEQCYKNEWESWQFLKTK